MARPAVTVPVPRQRLGLPELMVVLLALAALLVWGAPRLQAMFGDSKIQTTRQQIESLAASLELFRVDVGRYPTEREGLRALIERPYGAQGWRGPYVRTPGVPHDAWGRDFLYRNPDGGPRFDLLSFGSDGAEGGSGAAADIRP
jgi:general secretion pathway protein G